MNPHRYIIVSNGQIHDSTDSEKIAEYSARQLHETTSQEVDIYTRTFTIGVREEA